MRKVCVIATSMLFVGLIAGPGAARAAGPILESSEPPDGAVVESAPDAVSANFSEPLESSSTMDVFDECNRSIDDGSVQVSGDQMSVGLAEKPSGEYKVVYRAEGSSGVTDGSFSFTVQSGPSCDGAPQFVTSRPSPGSTVHRAPSRVSAYFSEDLDGSSTLTVRDECGRRVDDGAVQASGDELSVGVARKPSGRYTARYDATADGETTSGEFTFTVHMGPDCDGNGNHGHGNGNNGNGHKKHDRNGHGGDGRHHEGDHDTDHPTGHLPADHPSAHASEHGGRGDHSHRDGDHERGRHEGHAGHNPDPSHDEATDDEAADTNVAGAAPPPDEPNGSSTPAATALALTVGLSAALGLLGGGILRARA
jgi:methionine-rich copper-binding protein CopC